MEVNYTSLDDRALEQAAAAGDRDAFGALYNRHFDRVYDFTFRILRNADEAADIAQESFLRAMKGLKNGKKKAAFSTWLFIIARNLALNKIQRSRWDVTPIGDRAHVFEQIDVARLGDPEAVAAATELAHLVWEAANGLDPKQYSLLDLHLRQGLDSGEIAQVLGITKGNAYTKLSRLKDAFESSVVALILTRGAGNRCGQLSELIRDRPVAEMTPSLRRIIGAHVQNCAACEDRKRRLLSPSALFGAFAAVPAPIGLKQRGAEAWKASWEGMAGDAAGVGPFHALEVGRTVGETLSTRTMAVLALLILASVVGGRGGWLALRNGGGNAENTDAVVLPALVSPSPSGTPNTMGSISPAPSNVTPGSAENLIITFWNNLQPSGTGEGLAPGPYYDKPGLICDYSFSVNYPTLLGVWQVDSVAPIKNVQWETIGVGLAEGWIIQGLTNPSGAEFYASSQDKHHFSQGVFYKYDDLRRNGGRGPLKSTWTFDVTATDSTGRTVSVAYSVEC